MPKTYVKIEDDMNLNSKVRGVSLAARWTYVASICHAGRTLSNGEIATADLGLVDGTPKIAKELMDANLWERRDRGWYIHDYLVYNRSREQVEEIKRTNAVNGRKGLANRYANRHTDGEANRLADGVASARSVSSVLVPNQDLLGVQSTETQSSESPSETLAKRHKPIDEAFIAELQAEHPTVNVMQVYERAQNRKNWDGYKDKRRALRDHIGYAIEDQRRNGNGARNGSKHARPDEDDPILRRLQLDREREAAGGM